MATASLATDVGLRLLTAALILASTYVGNILFGRLIIGIIWKKNRSVAYEISRVGSIIIWTAGVLLTMPVLGASDSVVSVVILLVGAFLIIATRDFAGNWFAGQMIKTIIPFRVGDWVRTSGAYGRVARIDNLYTTLITPENETVVIPNGKVTSEIIVDRTTNGSIKVPLELEVGTDIDFAEISHAARSIVEEISNQFSDVGESKGPEVYIVSQSRASMRIKVVLEISNPAREDEVVSEFRRRFSEVRIPADESSRSRDQLPKRRSDDRVT